jgi:hypothetical protein
MYENQNAAEKLIGYIYMPSFIEVILYADLNEVNA